MRLPLTLFALLVLVAYVESMPRVGRVIPLGRMDYSLMKHHNYLARRIAHEAHAVINHQAYHQRDVIQPASMSSPATGTVAPPAASPNAQDVTISPNIWRNQTAEACMGSLSAMNGRASNPSGLAACYNVRSWNSTLGIFEADLQLYRVAAATGDWVALMTQAVNVGLSYSGATVAPSSGNHKRSQEGHSRTRTESPSIEGTVVRRAAAAAPSMVQEMTFVGKIDKDKMSQVNDV